MVIRTPILKKVIPGVDVHLLRAEVRLFFRSRNGLWIPQRFLMDTGTELTTLPASTAHHRLNCSLPESAMRLRVNNVEKEVRLGTMEARVASSNGPRVQLPCAYVGPLEMGSAQTQPAERCLLGLTGLVNFFRLTFDGSPQPTSPHGFLILETA